MATIEYEVTNIREEPVTVDGLGVLPPNSSTVFSQVEADSFAYLRGLKLLSANVPNGVEVTLVVEGNEEESE